MALWLKGGGEASDIAVSTRVRLARNIKGTPFPHKLQEDEKRRASVIDPVKSVFIDNGGDFTFCEMKDLSDIEKTRLVEQHIISKELSQKEHGALVLSPDEAVSIMLLEEDHYRFQCIKSGFDTKAAFGAAKEMERMLGEQVTYAFDDSLGYLTACPTNVGSGLRVSVMLHLKGLAMSDAVSSVLSSLGRYGVTARGMYGEGSQAAADMYQISNQITLGVKDEEIVKNLHNVVQNLIDNEREVRRILYKNNRLEIDDRVMRAYGILKYAKKIDTQEAMTHLSTLNLGIGLGIIAPCTQDELYNLIMEVMPAMLTGEGSDASSRDTARAKLIQQILN